MPETWDGTFYEGVLQTAHEAELSPGHRPTGCALLDAEGKVIICERNQIVGQAKDGTLHAEMAAVASLAREALGRRPVTVVTSHINPDCPDEFQNSRPCLLCSTVLKAAGVKTAVYFHYGQLVVERLR